MQFVEKKRALLCAGYADMTGFSVINGESNTPLGRTLGSVYRSDEFRCGLGDWGEAGRIVVVKIIDDESQPHIFLARYESDSDMRCERLMGAAEQVTGRKRFMSGAAGYVPLGGRFDFFEPTTIRQIVADAGGQERCLMSADGLHRMVVALMDEVLTRRHETDHCAIVCDQRTLSRTLTELFLTCTGEGV